MTTRLYLWAPLPGPWLALLADGWRMEWPRGSHHEVWSVLLWPDETRARGCEDTRITREE